MTEPEEETWKLIAERRMANLRALMADHETMSRRLEQMGVENKRLKDELEAK